MALTQKLQFRQTQALVMTPQLMQAIKLLQLSNLDLTAHVDAELERNPLLERANDGEGEVESREDAQAPEAEGASASEDWLSEELDTSRSTIEDRLDTSFENVFPDDSGERVPAVELPPHSEWAGIRGTAREDGDYNLEAFVSAEATLSGHLAEQMALVITDARDKLIAQYLIDLVDETGYFTGSLTEVAEKLGASTDQVEAVLKVLQTLEPSGVCARNLAECLAIQLKDRNRFDPAMQTLVEHLDLLAKRDLASLRKLCGVDEQDLFDMVAELRALDPKPGLAFGSAPVQPVIPDVFVRKGPDETWMIELNSDTLPKVLVCQSYYAEVSKTAKNPTEKAYLADCLQSASWLVRALDQRAKTILKVATEIVNQQEAFLLYGVAHLKPLNLKTVAEAIGMHESTVSRVTANKYMATSRGIFELKYFFTSAIAAADGGEAHSAEAVRHRIRRLIDSESVSDVLSDDTIVDKLRGAGIDIARRTVAKYREAMRIPSSVQRRREKQTLIGSN
jgi:RNA polymerase sigma-54 factor